MKMSIGSCLFGLLLSTLALPAQDILHYKFESGAGATEINYGEIDPGIPRLGQIVPEPLVSVSQAWTTGKFGTGLAAGPLSPNNGFELDTGWDGVVGTGVDVTIAMFFRTVHPVPPNYAAPFCGPPFGVGPGLKMGLIGTPPSYGFIYLAWFNDASTGNSVTLAQDLLTPSFSNWVHVAIVISRSGPTSCQTATVQWYVNGVPQISPLPNGCFHDIAGTSLQTFRFGRRGEAYCKFDDCRLLLRAASAAEILQWATTDRAGHGPFGEACHPFGVPVLLWGSGGQPMPGNANYQLTVYGLPGSSAVLGLGFSNTTFAGNPLPANLGSIIPSLAGCQLRVSADAIFNLVIGPTGRVDQPMSIPALGSLVGVDAYAQAVLYSSILGAWSSTNAWAVHVGN